MNMSSQILQFPPVFWSMTYLFPGVATGATINGDQAAYGGYGCWYAVHLILT